jgi:hypothetical protein
LFALAITILIIFILIGVYLTLFSRRIMYWIERIRNKFKKKQSEFFGYKIEDPTFYPIWFRVWIVIWRIVGIFLTMTSVYILYRLLL